MTPRLLWSATMPKLSLVSMGVILISTFAFAEPIYLNCEVFNTNNQKMFYYSVTIDESINKVTEALDNGYIYTTTGIFLHDKITYEDTSKRKYGKFETTIDRTSLEIIKMIDFYLDKSHSKTIDKGICKIIKTQGKKI